MTAEAALDQLWDSASGPADHRFHAAQIAHLPRAAQGYLEHSIAPGTYLASAVRLRMHGEIKLRRWLPFSAEQVIAWDRGMIWRATIRLSGLPITGYDRLVDGIGTLRWRLLGVIPVMSAGGPHITRSAAGRLAAESVWLPSVLCAQKVRWTAEGESHVWAAVEAAGHHANLGLTTDHSGRLLALQLLRWGNPEGDEFHDVAFGGVVEEERAFQGYTIPRRLRIGWYYGTDRFENDGEFFRVTVDEATYRLA